MINPDPHGPEPVVRRGPPLAEADGLVLLLHGRGASATDILLLGPLLASENYAYWAPEAAGHTWYPNSFLAPIASNEPFLTSAIAKIAALVDEAGAQGMTPDRIVIAGFSQGACLSCEFVARHPRRYKAVIAFTGGLIGPPGADLAHSGNLQGTPAFLAAGDPDPHVPWERVEASAAVLRSMNALVTAKRYPGLPHTVSEDEIRSARALLDLS